MKFTPRLTDAGIKTSPYWRTDATGYNKCIPISGISALPNCVGYAYGRFMECAGIKACNLPTSDAGKWYYEADAYPKGKTPKVGAVACYRDTTGGAGHVGIVEQVNSDGSIITSNSAFGDYSLYWYRSTLQPPYYTWSSQFSLIGFIYNTHLGQSVSKDILKKFISTATEHLHDKFSWVRSTLNCGNVAWNGAFVLACARLASEMLGTVLEEDPVPRLMITKGVDQKFGSFIKGPRFGSAPKPQVGDIVAFRNTNRNFEGLYDCDEIGIVTEVLTTSFTAVLGDQNSNSIYLSTIEARKCRFNTNTISGYYRPKWSRIDESIADYANCGLYTSAQLYETQNTAEDAILREVGYVDDSYKPSISTSGIRLSVVNYTDLLAAFVSHINVAGSLIDEGSSNAITLADGVNNASARAVINYFTQKGLNAAAAVAIAANIQGESGFNLAAVGDFGTSFGLCQWHLGRAENMNRMAGANWSTNLSGQLDYLWHELTNSYPVTYTALKSADNTLSGAKYAVGVFVADFERPQDVAGETSKRQGYAAEFWNQIVIQKV